MSEVNVGEGWRLLRVPERIEAGDQYLDERDGWKGVRVEVRGVVWSPYLRPHRRRVPAATADAHPWCRDVDRDLAARGSERREDTIMHRDLPDAIHRLNGLVAGLAERLAELERQVSGEVGRG
jgi:hypothetical protein